MAQAKTTPPPPGAKIRATKSMIGTQKELSDDNNSSSSSDTIDADGHEEVKKIENSCLLVKYLEKKLLQTTKL